MSGFSFKIVLFYVMAAYLFLAATAAPAATTTQSRDEGSTTTEALPGSTAGVPSFQCSALSDTEYQKSISSLFFGIVQASNYFNQNLNPGQQQCSPDDAGSPISSRLEQDSSLELGFAILKAYSTIAQFASQSDSVSEADRTKMQIVHELLNALVINYYEVVSRNHCSCSSTPSNNCITITDLDYLKLDSYPPSCSPSAYVSINLYNEVDDVLTKLRTSIDFIQNFNPLVASCQQWKDDYLPSTSLATSAITCSA